MAHLLTGVASKEGTSPEAAIAGYDVAGKTGTAQKADPAHGGYSAKKRVGSFVGFVPANDPRLVALVLIDEPEVNVYGGVVAAPVFRNIAQDTLRRLAVAPEKTAPIPSATKQSDIPVRRATKASLTVATGGATDGVPDFVGLSLREALEKAQSMKVKVRLQGNGYVVKQAPAAGSQRTEDDVLMLNLQG
jgi:cell division protein FtsI (penicillin-binding protein 3)